MSPVLKVLVGCETSGTFRNALIKRGINAMSVDLKPTQSPGPHYTGSIFDVLDDDWTHLICFPPCRYLAKVQMHKYKSEKGRIKKRDEAVEFVRCLMSSGIEHIALENPAGFLSSGYKPYSQLIRPWFFGDPYNKEICLWLKNLPPIISTCYSIERKSICNHVNGRMSQVVKSEIKSSWKYFPLMVDALVNQWFPPYLDGL